MVFYRQTTSHQKYLFIVIIAAFSSSCSQRLRDMCTFPHPVIYSRLGPAMSADNFTLISVFPCFDRFPSWQFETQIESPFSFHEQHFPFRASTRGVGEIFSQAPGIPPCLRVPL
ncbi:hypothetical protein I7I50_05165 [Histoplasma capsulatum G186AR]|uniref:Uncharacterized protein n=1 Tax=Ajellomyces capsulatus TaxID=5037 RepID=A0A8H8D9U1_AJECA|nr:hypothetical protein I7I52_03423 [Histoplasma capsulatum]QSS75882.1 hypothetical protein I7I50_05165 [Histoplasma capsulatum G186AR]